MSNKTEFLMRILLAEQEQNHAKMKALIAKHGEAFDRVIMAMPADALTSASIDYLGPNIYASGNKHDLAGCVRALRVNGFKSDSAPPGKHDSSWTAFFHNEEGAKVYFNFSSKVCRRVKVGTKMVEQDLYETVCDEQTFPAAEQQIA